MIELVNTTKYPLNRKKIIALSEAFLEHFKNSRVDVSLAIVGASRIKKLNNDYRGFNKTTDVLSFAGAEWEGNLLGEVIINPGELKKLSKYKEILIFTGFAYPPKNRLKAETYLFYFILIHGLLHLIGYDDELEKDRQEMLSLGRNFLTKCDII